MPSTKRTGKTITLGSGDLFIVEYSSETIKGFTDDPATACTPENLLGGISGGAALKYSSELYTATDDSGKYQKTILSSESATLTSGIITWNAKTLQMLTSTARVSEDSSKHTRTIKIGGVGNYDGKSYMLCFHHTDKADGDVWVIVRGTNGGDLELSFKKDEETTIDAEFTCLSQDDEGTLITLVEQTGTN